MIVGNNTPRCALLGAIWVACLSGAAPAGPPPEPPVAIRITWGGGKAAAWSGSIRVIDGGTAPVELDWRMLSSEPDAAATMHADGDAILIHEPRGLDLNGVEIRVADWRRARLGVQIGPVSSREPPATVEIGVAELLEAPVQKPLDGNGNRLTVRRAPGDELRFAFEGSGTALRRPGETVQFVVHPLLPPQTSAAAAELRVRLKRSADGTELHSQTVKLEEAAASAGQDAGGREPRAYAPVAVAVPLSGQEGAYDIELEVVDRGGLRWSRGVASRRIQVAAVADVSPEAPAGEKWSPVYELDPGSPKLLERLRRLPGVGMPAVSVPGVPLPKMPMPSFSLPKVPIPKASLAQLPLPSVPLPNVSVPKLPSVSDMVPRITGLLAVGHSTLETHPLGPMLALPPSNGREPAWEGISLGSVEPGMPHLVEIEYPLDQDAVVGVAILEQPAAAVRATATSGFDVQKPLVPAGTQGRPQLATHRFVFWPHTRSPLVLISNMSSRSPAVFGRVRVLAGPSRLAGRPKEPSRGASRPTHLFLSAFDFAAFGAADRLDPVSGRPVADWSTFLGGVRRSAEWALAQGAAGAMIGVYADGASVWPSNVAPAVARWDSGGSFDGATDPAPKDLLDLVCRVFEREGLRLVPAIVCNGAMPALDGVALRAGSEGVGILCVGRDGRPYAASGRRASHYNILDPRVQAAVEAIVVELAGRLRSSPAVEGVAVVMPHDGWLHLPGIAWGLDDVTFARFVAESAQDVEPLARPVLGDADPRRFAGRAAVVEGPLREAWLAWREGVVAAFHARLAAAIAAGNPSWKLYVAPTTLFVAGESAGWFRPTLSADPGDADVLRAFGLDPARITAHDRVVYVSPHVHGSADDAVERGVLHAANHSLPLLRGSAQAARRAAVFVERPVEMNLKAVLPHAPFAASAVEPVAVTTPAGGLAARRPLAESLVASDIEAVFDMGLACRCVDEADLRGQRALESLPAAALEVVAEPPAPLVVRTRSGEAGTWVSVTNACGSDCRAAIVCDGRPTGVVDVVAKTPLPLGPAGECLVGLGAWETKTLVVEGDRRVVASRASFDAGVQQELGRLLDGLRRRRSSLEMAVPMAALDNPGFELPDHGGVVPGWELLEPQRGSLAFVAGRPSAGVKGARFSSANGLSTLRSNPFQPPATGRISVAVWMRIADGEPQPPLRIAIEGVQDDREYYRFAAVGRGDGSMPLSTAWSQFVLQVDDLPTLGLETLRVRLDLLGPGSVEIDDVRVFDLAFDESQRVQLSKLIAIADQRLKAGDFGGCIAELDGYWPRFLLGFVSADDPEIAGKAPPGAGGGEATPPQPARAGVMDRVRRWWQ